MNTVSKLALTWLCSASVSALGVSIARAQTNDQATTPETVVVTGSRVVTEIQNSPTPITVVPVSQLDATTPGNLPDALNKLPDFQGSSSQRNNSTAGSNGSGNFLNLRNFGQQRTLVLLDGHRQVADSALGAVNSDTLPQMLVQRVDVVTGGASAVYGSDAVTGVVNFVLDNNYTGVKMDINGGISGYGDGASQKTAIAVGSSLFGGRGHFESSLEYYHSDRITDEARELGRQNWELGGAGSASNPYHYIEYGGLDTQVSTGGEITCSACGNLNGMQFNPDGSAVIPVNLGLPSGVSGLQSGGDGVYANNSSLQVALRREDWFGRLSYNVNDSTVVYMNLTAAEALDQAPYYPAQIRAGSIFSSSDPYLPAAVAAQMTQPTFTYATWFTAPQYQGYTTWNDTRKLQASIGADGQIFGKFDWDLFYEHGEDRDNIKDPTNANNQRVFAASDAVLVTNANVGSSGLSVGSVACEVSLTAYASLYPGCVPLNPFGANTLTTQAYNYAFGQPTEAAMTNTLDDIEGSISGNVWDLPAGPITAALSGEARWNGYMVTAPTPYGVVNCTGLRYCIAGKNLYDQTAVVPAPYVSDNVWEFALETNIPVLKNVPFIQDFEINSAGRITNYSTSGIVETWKLGFDYHVNDDVRFRGTNSVDIRAPALNELYSPPTVSTANYTDLHTNQIQRVNDVVQGNPNLVPEVARTYTAGVVFTPTFVPGLTASFDYYQIRMKNAISQIAASNTSVQALCELSNGTSQFCSLAIRPLPFSNHTAANFPTEILTDNLNTAYTDTEGEDIEADYSFDLNSVWNELSGTVNIRELANIQPYVYTSTFSGAEVTNAVQPKGRVVSFVGYAWDSWQLSLQHRWYSNFINAANPLIIYSPADERTRSDNTLDVTIDDKFPVGGHPIDAYLSIQNIFNTVSPIYTTDQSNPGRQFPVSTQEDAVGRYFTLGFRTSF